MNYLRGAFGADCSARASYTGTDHEGRGVHIEVGKAVS